LEALNAIDGLEWIRVLYTYPTRLADELEWAYVNLEKMIPYLDLPLQHLSDPVLERMRRGTPYEQILEHLTRLRKAVPNLVVRSTCIVGFPGETDADFSRLEGRFEALDVDHLGVFQYSDEEGTPAVDLRNKVPAETASYRFERMSKSAAWICQEKAETRLDSKVEVLVDGPCLPPEDVFPCIDASGKWWRGRWWGQAPEIDGVVYFRSEDAEPGRFVSVQLDDTLYPDYLGKIP
jgi:ribosomal protein S12 methylthiotransferase